MNLHNLGWPSYVPDYCSLTGAEKLAATIRSYWAGKGRAVNVRVEKVIAPRSWDWRTGSLFAVRSDMVDGWPRRAT